MSELEAYLRSLSATGIPYKEGGADPKTGFECYSFVRYVFKAAGILLSENVYETEGNFSFAETAQLLDIAVIRHSLVGERHVGIMLNGFEMIHCSHYTNGVGISDFTRHPWLHAHKRFARHVSFSTNLPEIQLHLEGGDDPFPH